MIEDQVIRSSVRTAKIAFWIVLVVVGVPAAVVAADHWHPIVALIVGALVGTAVGLVVAAVVAAWPVIRVLWWWLPEITTVLGLGAGWVELAAHTTLPVRLAVVAVAVGTPAALPPLRRRIVAAAWCLITRHRLRTCFAQFIITNRTAALPLILWAHPIPVGERVWVWLRPGLSAADLEAHLDKIAAACWAATCTVERASATNAALVRLNIKRRDALTGTVVSPLVTAVDGAATPTGHPTPAAAPTALDLPDVTADTLTPVTRAAKTGQHKPDTPAKSARPAAPAIDGEPDTVPAVAGPGGDDLADWID